MREEITGSERTDRVKTGEMRGRRIDKKNRTETRGSS